MTSQGFGGGVGVLDSDDGDSWSQLVPTQPGSQSQM